MKEKQSENIKIKELLSKEKEIIDFTLKLQKKSRKKRFQELKKKGLI